MPAINTAEGFMGSSICGTTWNITGTKYTADNAGNASTGKGNCRRNKGAEEENPKEATIRMETCAYCPEPMYQKIHNIVFAGTERIEKIENLCRAHYNAWLEKCAIVNGKLVKGYEQHVSRGK